MDILAVLVCMLLVVFLALLKCKLAEEHEDLKNLFLSL